jgi:ABC-type branched-subunit amino acid transport system permease subunit
LSTFNGLPAHVLLVHFIVILAPLTAILAIVCAFWPAARHRLVWLVLGLAAVTAVLTPLTTDAGEWLEKREGRSPLLHAHTELGDTMLYFSIALVAAAALIAFVHVRDVRGKSVKPVARWLVAAVVVIASVATAVQVYRIGDSGAKATWGQESAAGSTTP